MIVDVLCPGPSLAKLFALPIRSHQEERVVMAINHAMSHECAISADWWVALDLWNVPLPRYAPRRGLVTSSAAIEEGQAERVPYPLYDFRRHPRSRPTATTLPAALWWAVALGATEACLHGCDLVGTSDFLGPNLGSIRTPDRWARERAEIATVQDLTGLTITGLRPQEHA
jgi:hypothetical protein